MRTITRKAGADMTNALLWAAFSIVVLLSVLALSETIRISNLHKQTLSTITYINREMDLMQKMGLPDSEVGSKVAELYQTMKVDGYPALLVQSNPTNGPRFIKYAISFFGRANDKTAVALCTRILAEQTNPNVNISQGLLGENYLLSGSRCQLSGPTITVIYYIRSDRGNV